MEYATAGGHCGHSLVCEPLIAQAVAAPEMLRLLEELPAADWPGAFPAPAASLHRRPAAEQNLLVVSLEASLALPALGEPGPLQSPFRRQQAAASAVAATVLRLQ